MSHSNSSYNKSASRPSSPDTLPKLPKSMSGLIEIAIADARSLNPFLYRPICRQWHTKPLDGPCEICLAGSVIAGTFKTPANNNRYPWYFEPDTESKFCAIDSMRCGCWERAFNLVYGFGPIPAIGKRLYELDKPAHVEFNGWDEFHAHLDSLEELLPSLREIEAAAFAS